MSDVSALEQHRFSGFSGAAMAALVLAFVIGSTVMSLASMG